MQTAKILMKRIEPIIHNRIFDDDYWLPVHKIRNLLEDKDLILSWYAYDCKYFEENGISVSKKWQYFCRPTNIKHSPFMLIVICSGCGTVDNPLSKYDVVAYTTPLSKDMLREMGEI